MQYHHTQKAPLYLGLLAVAVGLVVNAWFVREPQWVLILLLSVAVGFVFLALSFRHLTIRDQGDALAIEFGPLPVFRTQIPYAAIKTVEAGRSALIDGLGIHYIPGRGWTYNLWGADCVVVRLADRTVRVGTNDQAELLAFLQTKITPEG